MAKRGQPAPNRLSAKQKAARKAAGDRLRALNAARRTEVTTLKRAAKGSLDRKAAQLNRQARVVAQEQVAHRAERAHDANFF